MTDDLTKDAVMAAAMKQMQLPMTYTIEPARRMQAPGYPHDHEIRVALPPGYAESGESYPVLWLTDGSLNFELGVGIIQYISLGGEVPPMIIASIGCPRETKFNDFMARRLYDFSPNEHMYYEGVGGRIMGEHEMAKMVYPEGPPPNVTGGAPALLDFLVDDVRAALAKEYRMQEDCHTLFGLSAGGQFVGYSLFGRPYAFQNYICGSPFLYGGNFQIFDMEEAYATKHDDLPVSIYFGAGDEEIHDFGHACSQLVGSMIRLGQILTVRQYPSLNMETRIFHGENHASMTAVLIQWALRRFFAHKRAQEK